MKKWAHITMVKNIQVTFAVSVNPSASDRKRVLDFIKSKIRATAAPKAPASVGVKMPV